LSETILEIGIIVGIKEEELRIVVDEEGEEDMMRR
jgi:hypothetical protein